MDEPIVVASQVRKSVPNDEGDSWPGVVSIAPAAGLSLISLVNLIVRQRAIVVGFALSLAALATAFRLSQRREYTATASFVPQVRRSAATGLAEQFGLALPTAEATQSPAFYAALLNSRIILGNVVSAHYSLPDVGTDSARTLVDAFGIHSGDPSWDQELAVQRLRGSMNVRTDLKTGVVSVGVSGRSANLVSAIVEQLISQVNEFNLQKRQSQAASERRFTGRRLREVAAELRGSEDSLEGFLQRNREYRSSPVLVFAQDRLSRAVAFRQQLYVTLAQAFEQAKIEEVRDTPVITVIERPMVPVRPDSRGLLVNGILSLIVGAFGGVLLALLREWYRNLRATGNSEVAELDSSVRFASRWIPWR